MDKDCKGTMMLVDGYVKNGNEEKALPLLKEIIKKYPGTEWAKKAAARKAEIEKGM